MLLLLLLPLVHASEFVTGIGPELTVGVGGGWARAFPDGDGGWRFLWSAGGDYALLPMDDDLTVEDRGRVQLTGHTDLIDHGIAACPDGSFLHVASYSESAPNDGAVAFRYDADFTRTAEYTVVSGVPMPAHNDPALLCSDEVTGVAYGDGDEGTFHFLGDDDVTGTGRLEGMPVMNGGELHWEADSGTLLALQFDHRGELTLGRYEADLALVETRTLETVPSPYRGFWPQAVVRLGDVYMVAHMAADDDAGFENADGDLWLSFYDLEWNLLGQDQVSQNTPPVGGMRPWIARDGEETVLLYDKEVLPRAYAITLDFDALGADPGDTGFDSPGDDDDDDDDGDASGGCGGCGGNGAGAWLLLLAPFRRRGRTHAPERDPV